MTKVIAFIPARCGSKSIRLKNIKSLCGRPLIYWNLEALQDCDLVHQIIVATDCDEIQNIVENYNFSKASVYRRSDQNAKDHSSTESVMLEYIEKENLDDTATFMLVQLTSPLTKSNHFTEAIQKYEDSKVDSLLSCVRIKRFFWSEDGTSKNYDFYHRPLRQDWAGELMENGAFYINNVKNIKTHKNRLSGTVAIYEMPEYTSIELDEPDDWAVAEKLMRKYRISSSEAKQDILLFVSDVDGVLTDAGMYYSEMGDELKKFNTHDGKAFQLMREKGIKTAIITSEDTNMVLRRAKKLKSDYLFQGKEHGGKLKVILEICKKENFDLKNVAYVGDDINCKEALENVGIPACPSNALSSIKAIPGIIVLESKGGEGVIREFYERYL